MAPDFPYNDPNFPYSPRSQPDPDRSATQRVMAPDEVTGPVKTGQPETGPTHGHHTGHNHWMHLLMCAPMFLIVGYLVLTGKAGGGSILYAVGCLVMMGAMMAMMNRGSSTHGSSTHGPSNQGSGHRH